MDEVVTRLHRCLVEAMRRRGPEGANRAVTVAEIYQDLVPYRSVRSELGVDMNADYEHALLRLLSGEHGLLRLEPPEARKELREELASHNPNVGIFRKFAACDVWVNPGAVAAGQDGDADTGGSAGAAAVAVAREPAPPAASPAAPAAPAPEKTGRCPFCAETLPPDRTARYCPQCGKDQRQRPCPTCGEVLERAWRFCIACGTAADSRQPAGGPPDPA